MSNKLLTIIQRPTLSVAAMSARKYIQGNEENVRLVLTLWSRKLIFIVFKETHYFTENTLRLHYKGRLVNVVEGSNHCNSEKCTRSQSVI
jgi:hypothetical protein